MKEFFGIGGYSRAPEGFLSPAHIIFVTSLMAVMIFLGIFLGRKNRLADEKKKMRAITVCAIAIDAIELFKIVFLCFRENNPMHWIINLPLFLCSLQLIALPLAAFSKGRVREASLDFIFIFGLLGAVLGTYGAGQNYACYPVLSFDNVVSGVTHTISGFASLYIGISGLSSMKKRNVPLTFLIITVFGILAYVADILIPYNYMFLIRGDGTPYDIFYNLVGGNPVLYPMIVMGLFYAYIAVFYAVTAAVKKKKLKTEE